MRKEAAEVLAVLTASVQVHIKPYRPRVAEATTCVLEKSTTWGLAGAQTDKRWELGS